VAEVVIHFQIQSLQLQKIQAKQHHGSKFQETYDLESFPQTLHLAELRYASMEGAGDFLGFLSTIVPPMSLNFISCHFFGGGWQGGSLEYS